MYFSFWLILKDCMVFHRFGLCPQPQLPNPLKGEFSEETKQLTGISGLTFYRMFRVSGKKKKKNDNSESNRLIQKKSFFN